MATKKPATNIWIKLSSGGTPVWINVFQVRRIEAVYDHKWEYPKARIVYTSKDFVHTDQSFDEVMVALGYKVPSPKPIETHALPAPPQEGPSFAVEGEHQDLRETTE